MAATRNWILLQQENGYNLVGFRVQSQLCVTGWTFVASPGPRLEQCVLGLVLDGVHAYRLVCVPGPRVGRGGGAQVSVLSSGGTTLLSG